MISIKIKDHKQFMDLLLTSTTFDSFELKEANFVKNLSIFIDGKDQEKKCIEQNNNSQYISFSNTRNLLFDCLKGKALPKTFKIILLLPITDFLSLLSTKPDDVDYNNISHLLINIKYLDDVITLTSSLSYSDFTLDKTIERLWDKYLIYFLEKNNVSFIELNGLQE